MPGPAARMQVHQEVRRGASGGAPRLAPCDVTRNDTVVKFRSTLGVKI
jgi:hypothetical protein